MTMKKTMQRGSHQPIHRYVEASLNEEQDRIRYFAYKKNRIITLIEMPRSKPNQADLMNAYERRHQSRHTNPNTKDKIKPLNDDDRDAHHDHRLRIYRWFYLYLLSKIVLFNTWALCSILSQIHTRILATLDAYKQAYESQPKTYPPRLLQCDTLLASDTAYSKAMGDTNTAAIGAMSCAVSDENVSVCKGDERDKTL
eukprot:97175_1